MSNFEIFIAYFLTFLVTACLCFFAFGGFLFNRAREKSIKEFKQKHRIDL